MTPETEALARRATQAKGWRWMPGMLTLDDADGRGWRVVVGDVLAQTTGRRLRSPAPAASALLPDLEDPATLGCLLALVRAAYDDAAIFVERRDGSWWANDDEGTMLCAHPGAYEKRQCGERCCVGGPCHKPAAGATEAEALVLALEAAPVSR